MSLGGFVCVRNTISLDYCWTEAIESLLPVCDKVLICDSSSTDGTREAMDKWAAKEPKIILANYPWTDPRGDPWWFPAWLNYARQHLPTDWCITLDADEILHEESYDRVRAAAAERRTVMCHRYNFWRDPQTLIPEGHCCGFEVIRIGPQNLNFPSDYPWPGHTAEIEALAVREEIKIMHYGFIREKEAFFRKAREVQRIWSNSYDPRLEEAEKKGKDWASDLGISDWVKDVVPYTGTHPEIIKPWLRERGYTI